MVAPTRPASTSPRARCEGFFYVMNGVLLGSFLIYLLGASRTSHMEPLASNAIVEKCASPPIRGADAVPVSSPKTKSSDKYAFVHSPDVMESCLDPEGPLPVIIVSLGRSGTDSTWEILKTLTGTTMKKAIEIVGGYESNINAFFRALDGFSKEADQWVPEDGFDWRKQGGGEKASKGFYHDDLREYCADGYCRDGKWMFKWFCDEQQRYKDVGGLVGFKWKAYMSTLRMDPAYNALKIAGQLAHSQTPIRVIRSRRNPFDVYLSELKHSVAHNLPDHCKADDEECFKKHASVRLTVPVDDMYEWLKKTYKEENEVDALLSELGVPTIHVSYDDLYYARSEKEGLAVWNSIFRFLGKKDDWEWTDISNAAGLEPTTKSRSHKVLIENFDEVYEKLKDTSLEQFIRF